MAFKWKSIVAHMHNTAANKKPLHQQHMGQRLRFARQALLTPLRLRGRQICGSGNDEDAAAADETAAENGGGDLVDPDNSVELMKAADH